jgi:homocysteine S-methyltransferase
VNCVKPEIVGTAIEALKAGSSKAVVAYPNSGEHWEANTQDWRGSRDHDGLAALALGWVSAGARLIGGCCRIGPAEIAALAAALSKSG